MRLQDLFENEFLNAPYKDSSDELNHLKSQEKAIQKELKLLINKMAHATEAEFNKYMSNPRNTNLDNPTWIDSPEYAAYMLGAPILTAKLKKIKTDLIDVRCTIYRIKNN